MNLLLDTHTFLWQSHDPSKIPKAALRALGDNRSTLWVSAASLWEIGILASLKRIELSVSVRTLLEQSSQDAGIQLLAIEPLHVDLSAALPFFHRDPFDRLLIAQAKAIEAVVVGRDHAFDRYGIERVWK